MPSVSKAQQRFMGLVHAYKKGEVPASKVSQAVKDAAKSMKKKSTKKMASTKHKGLPNKVRSENMNEDGHTDVASAERKLKLIMKDAMDTLNALKNLSNEDSLPSWWTDKITLAKDYVGKSRDYIMNPAESVNEDITSAGYYFLRKAAYSITVALKDLNKGIKKEDDKTVLPEIEYIYDKATEMKKMLKNKRYNESINENRGAAIYMSVFEKLLKKQMGSRFKTSQPTEKDIRRVMGLMRKRFDEPVTEKVIKVSKKDDIPGNPMKMKGEEKIKKLTYSGSVGMDKPGSYEIKGNKLNVNNIRPRDKGFFVRHFTMGTGFRKANLYYDGVHWQGGKKF